MVGLASRCYGTMSNSHSRHRYATTNDAMVNDTILPMRKPDLFLLFQQFPITKEELSPLSWCAMSYISHISGDNQSG
jgi:hypothetical protein